MRIKVSSWKVVDALLDNTIFLSPFMPVAMSATSARILRERGWLAASSHDEKGLGEAGWPPGAAELNIALEVSEVESIEKTIAG